MNNTGNKIIPVVREAGLKLKELFERRHSYQTPSSAGNYREKGQHELVLEEDLVSDEILFSGLKAAFPEYEIYSEERENWPDFERDKNFKFLIDPLDGTHNYYYGLTQWGVAVSLIDGNNVPRGGYIYLPCSGLMLANSGEPGETTTLVHHQEKSTAQTAKREQMSQCMFAYDNQFYRLGPRAMKIYNKIAEVAFTTRISGSAAFDSVMVASGRYDARLWNNVRPYDIAASIPIVRGAGGYVCDFQGNTQFELDRGEVMICSNPVLGKKLIQLIRDA